VINESGEILGIVSLKAILGRISHENIDAINA
jgi:hypothetical protein